MQEFIRQFWDQGVDLATLIIAILALLTSAGLLRRRNRTLKDLIYVEQERDDLRKKLALAEVRLDHIDPERFIDNAASLYENAEFAKVEDLSLKFAHSQQEAFGKAAEYLTEQRILDTETHPQAIEDAKRFAAIGRAAFPDNKRIESLSDLAERRAADIENGDPIEALNFDGMTDVELNHLARALYNSGKFTLGEVAARRSVPKAALRTGRVSQNHAAALGTHTQLLEKLGQNDVAERLCQQVLEIDRATIGERHPTYAIHLNTLAFVVKALGRRKEAERLMRHALKIESEANGEGHPEYAKYLNNLAGILSDHGKREEAEGLYRQALEIDRATIGEEHPEYATHLNNLATVLAGQGKPDQARPLFEQALTIFKSTLPADHPNIANVERGLASLP